MPSIAPSSCLSDAPRPQGTSARASATHAQVAPRRGSRLVVLRARAQPMQQGETAAGGERERRFLFWRKGLVR